MRHHSPQAKLGLHCTHDASPVRARPFLHTPQAHTKRRPLLHLPPLTFLFTGVFFGVRLGWLGLVGSLSGTAGTAGTGPSTPAVSGSPEASTAPRAACLAASGLAARVAGGDALAEAEGVSAALSSTAGETAAGGAEMGAAAGAGVASTAGAEAVAASRAGTERGITGTGFEGPREREAGVR